MTRTSRDNDYLRHILQRVDRILTATKERDFSDYSADAVLQDAIERNIEVIGEAANKISKATRDRFSQVPWAELIGARNVIIHGYIEVDPERIWDIVQRDIPELHGNITEILRCLSHSQGNSE